MPTHESQNLSPADKNISIAPSVMCADICNLEEYLRELEKAGINLLHFDLMDSHFVPNMPISIGVDVPCGQCHWCRNGLGNNCHINYAIGIQRSKLRMEIARKMMHYKYYI